jgi:hypothetical protein
MTLMGYALAYPSTVNFVFVGAGSKPARNYAAEWGRAGLEPAPTALGIGIDPTVCLL